MLALRDISASGSASLEVVADRSVKRWLQPLSVLQRQFRQCLPIISLCASHGAMVRNWKTSPPTLLKCMLIDMALRIKSEHDAMSEINVTPLVDVMLVLLVIFIVTAPLMTRAVYVELPETKASAPVDPSRHLL